MNGNTCFPAWLRLTFAPPAWVDGLALRQMQKNARTGMLSARAASNADRPPARTSLSLPKQPSPLFPAMQGRNAKMETLTTPEQTFCASPLYESLYFYVGPVNPNPPATTRRGGRGRQPTIPRGSTLPPSPSLPTPHSDSNPLPHWLAVDYNSHGASVLNRLRTLHAEKLRRFSHESRASPLTHIRNIFVSALFTLNPLKWEFSFAPSLLLIFL